MWNTVECPYCEYENDMSDALTDLPSDNKFDRECTKCGEEFEVEVEFEPSYSSSKIEYVKCGVCGTKTRDIKRKGEIFPYPKSIDANEVCWECFIEGVRKDYAKR